MPIKAVDCVWTVHVLSTCLSEAIVSWDSHIVVSSVC